MINVCFPFFEQQVVVLKFLPGDFIADCRKTAGASELYTMIYLILSIHIYIYRSAIRLYRVLFS